MTMNPLKRLRQARGLEPEQIARDLGINTAWYYDLETGGENWPNEISLEGIRRLCRILDVSPMTLLAGRTDIVATPGELVETLRAHLQASGVSHEEFSEKIGWNVGPILRDPEELATFNGDGLQSICRELGLDWIVVLDTMRFGRP